MSQTLTRGPTQALFDYERRILTDKIKLQFDREISKITKDLIKCAEQTDLGKQAFKEHPGLMRENLRSISMKADGDVAVKLITLKLAELETY